MRTASILRKPVSLVLGTLLAGTSFILVGADPASAAPSGRVIASPSVSVRTEPNTNAGRVGTAPYNATVSILCTGRGSSVTGPYGTTSLWNYVDYRGMRGWVTDAYLYTGSNGAVAGACSNGGGSNVGAREQRAVAWAQSQVGVRGWNGWCLKFVANAFGRPSSGYPTAIAAFNAFDRRGLIHRDSNVPVGALAWYAPARVNGQAGHVQIHEASGTYISTADTVRRVSQSWPGATYLGWSYAPPEWAGR